MKKWGRNKLSLASMVIILAARCEESLPKLRRFKGQFPTNTPLTLIALTPRLTSGQTPQHRRQSRLAHWLAGFEPL